MSSFLLIREEVCSLSPIEKQGLQSLPNIGMAPVFTEDISWIQTALDMGETENLGGNGLTNAMIGQSGVAFGKLGVGNCTAGDHRLVVSEHIRFPF